MLFGLLLTSCVNRNITYVSVPPASQLIAERAKDGLPLTTKVVISGTTEIVPTEVPDAKIIKTPPVVQEGPPKNWCPPYHPPKLLPPPVAPADKLAAVPASDVDAVEKISADYIVELRNYIKTSQAVNTRAYNEYVNSCRALQKRTSKKD